MSMLRADASGVQSRPAEDWPESPDIDGYTWELGPVPSDDDARWWAAQNDAWDADDEPPDSWWDERAGEAEALDYLERGLRTF